jgi:RalA-binding protein 1
LPPPNYALLRALTAHLILIVQNSAINKMTLRNIGIVFSPTLGIPAGIFSDLVSHFGAIFDDEVVDDEIESVADETIKSNRNSMLYQAGGAEILLGLGGRSLDPGEYMLWRALMSATEDSASETSIDIPDSEAANTPSVESAAMEVPLFSRTPSYSSGTTTR